MCIVMLYSTRHTYQRILFNLTSTHRDDSVFSSQMPSDDLTLRDDSFPLKKFWAEIHSSQISNFVINKIRLRTSAKLKCATRDCLSQAYPRSAHKPITRQHPNALPTSSPSVTSQGSKRVATVSHYPAGNHRPVAEGFFAGWPTVNDHQTSQTRHFCRSLTDWLTAPQTDLIDLQPTGIQHHPSTIKIFEQPTSIISSTIGSPLSGRCLRI